MDYPDYLRIKARSRWLGLVWMLGDRAYYLGLLGGVGLIAGSMAATIVGGLLGFAPHQSEQLRLIPGILACVPACAAVFFGACWLKRFARRHSGLFEDEQ